MMGHRNHASIDSLLEPTTGRPRRSKKEEKRKHKSLEYGSNADWDDDFDPGWLNDYDETSFGDNSVNY